MVYFIYLWYCSKVFYNEEGEWKEDERHSARLDRGWDLEVVRDAAYSALSKVGRERMHFRPPDEQNNHKVPILCARYGRVASMIRSTYTRLLIICH
jgi:hypothetical protein